QTSLAGQRLAAALLLTSPHVPLLFMGQEYGEPHPFAYFTSHGDPELVRAVREGRRQEFAAFFEHGVEPPDPQDPATFERSRLDPTIASCSPHRELYALHRTLLRFRREHARAFVGQRPRCELYDEDAILVVHLPDRGQLVLVANLSPQERRAPLPPLPGRWTCVLDGGDPRFGGSGRVLDPFVTTPIPMPGFWFALLQRHAAPRSPS